MHGGQSRDWRTPKSLTSSSVTSWTFSRKELAHLQFLQHPSLPAFAFIPPPSVRSSIFTPVLGSGDRSLPPAGASFRGQVDMGAMSETPRGRRLGRRSHRVAEECCPRQLALLEKKWHRVQRSGVVRDMTSIPFSKRRHSSMYETFGWFSDPVFSREMALATLVRIRSRQNSRLDKFKHSPSRGLKKGPEL